jgi:hypothetical protein
MNLREEFEPMLLSPNGFAADAASCAKEWDSFGYRDFTSEEAIASLRAQVEAASRWLSLCGQRKSINSSGGGSYSLKHQAERWSRSQGGVPYICNGALLMAAVRLGFKLKRPSDVRPDYPNAWLNISQNRPAVPRHSW